MKGLSSTLTLTDDAPTSFTIGSSGFLNGITMFSSFEMSVMSIVSVSTLVTALIFARGAFDFHNPRLDNYSLEAEIIRGLPMILAFTGTFFFGTPSASIARNLTFLGS